MRVRQDVYGGLIVQNGPKGSRVSHYRFSNSASHAAKKNNAASHGPSSSLSSIICCAEITRPVSRVRSDAARVLTQEIAR